MVAVLTILSAVTAWVSRGWACGHFPGWPSGHAWCQVEECKGGHGSWGFCLTFWGVPFPALPSLYPRNQLMGGENGGLTHTWGRAGSKGLGLTSNKKNAPSIRHRMPWSSANVTQHLTTESAVGLSVTGQENTLYLSKCSSGLTLSREISRFQKVTYSMPCIPVPSSHVSFSAAGTGLI